MRGPVFGRLPLRVEIERARVGGREAMNRVVHHAEVLRAVAERGNPAGDRGVAGHRHVRQCAAVADGTRAPGDEVLVEILAVELRIQAAQVHVEVVGRAELHGDIAALADALLLEQRRADQRGRFHIDRRAGIRIEVAEHLDTIATQVALLIDAGDEHAERFLVVLPAIERRSVRIRLVGEVRMRGLHRAEERVRLQIERRA